MLVMGSSSERQGEDPGKAHPTHPRGQPPLKTVSLFRHTQAASTMGAGPLVGRGRAHLPPVAALGRLACCTCVGCAAWYVGKTCGHISHIVLLSTCSSQSLCNLCSTQCLGASPEAPPLSWTSPLVPYRVCAPLQGARSAPGLRPRPGPPLQHVHTCPTPAAGRLPCLRSSQSADPSQHATHGAHRVAAAAQPLGRPAPAAQRQEGGGHGAPACAPPRLRLRDPPDR